MSTEAKERSEDVEELRGVLSAVADFVREIREPLKELLDTLISMVKGSTLGEDVGTFYNKLIEQGVPQDLATELTRKYMESRVSILNVGNLLKSALERRGVKMKVKREGLQEEEE